jgi:hypothetical protein
VARKARPYWMCPCGHRNERAVIKCRGESCNRTRPKKRVPKHAEVLRDTPYEAYAELSVRIHGGELHNCAVCKRAPTKVKRHDRDHDHRIIGRARGIACSYCNRERLRGIADAAEARLVLAYFERVEKYYEEAA